LSTKVQVQRSAKGDIADAHAWYEAEQAGLGTEFLDEIAATLARIASGPERYPVVEADVRRALVPRFPYSPAP
jgi:toxin ParE1/3/4